ncbi:MAG TPA: BlaI/MecI/CopY family transcriptional regulator [Thermoanaerobaculia bacterium]|nr:BlaI/MecI/CopY family transcriptional regulator [Thermoanaerobaculia bacterium]
MIEDERNLLSRRERQILDVVYRLGRASVSQVRDLLPDAPSYSAVRGLMRILEDKGHLRHEQDGPRYVYSPTVSRDEARRSALSHLVETFFGGSVEGAVATLLDLESSAVDDATYRRLAELIERARKEGR